LRKGDNEAMIDFRDRSGQLVDVGTVNFKIDMNMAGMQMHGGATIEPTNTAGRYRAKIKIDMSGDWNTKISFDGPLGKGETSFSLTARERACAVENVVNDKPGKPSSVVDLLVRRW